MKIFKRWTVVDGISGEILPERFLFRRDAQDLKWATEFRYMLRAIQGTGPDYDVATVHSAIEVRKV